MPAYHALLSTSPDSDKEQDLLYPKLRLGPILKRVAIGTVLLALASVLSHSLSRQAQEVDHGSPTDRKHHRNRSHRGRAKTHASGIFASFEDVTESVGIKYTLADKTSSPSVGDINQDGFMDIVQSNHVKAPVEVFFGSSNGSFTRLEVFGEEKMDRHGTAIADYNGDGFPDIVLSVGWFFEGHPKFPPMIASSVGSSVRKLDRVDTYDIGLKPIRLQGNCSRAGVRMVDLDNDGDLDMFIMGRPLVPGANGNAIFENIGSGNFQYIPNTGIEHGKNQGFLFLDYNLDTLQDIILFTGGVQMFRNNGKNAKGTFSFTDVTSDVFPSGFPGHSFSGSAVLDFDNDGDFDVYLSGGERQKRPRVVADDVFLENVGGRFIDSSRKVGLPEGGAHIGITVSDFDNNGFVDVFIPRAGSLDESRLSDLILFNNGNRTFTVRDDHGANGPLDGTDESFGMGAQAFDYDRDGRVDLVVASRKHPSDGKLRLFKNTTPFNNANFLIVHVPTLVFGKASVDAIVQLTLPDGSSLMRRVGSVGESRTQSSVNDVHFGLGDARSVSLVVLTLSDGKTLSVADPAINTRIELGG